MQKLETMEMSLSELYHNHNEVAENYPTKNLNGCRVIFSTTDHYWHEIIANNVQEIENPEI